MKVKAKFLIGREDDSNHIPRVVGYYNGSRIREGDVFEIADEPYAMLDRFGKQVMREVRGVDRKPVFDENGFVKKEPVIISEFSEKWMEKVDDEVPVKRGPGRPKKNYGDSTSNLNVL